MNLTEKAYAKKRVDGIERTKLSAIKKSDFTTEAVEHSADKRLELFNQGKFEIKNPKENPFSSRYFCYIKDVFVFEGEVVEFFDDDKWLSARAKVYDAANQIRDQIMLGDADKALGLIQKFEKS